MSGEVEWCPILHVRLKFDVFTLPLMCKITLKLYKSGFFIISPPKHVVGTQKTVSKEWFF